MYWREPLSSGYGRRLMFQRSWVWIPAPYTGWTFFTFICCKNCNVYLKKTKINEKWAGDDPLKKRAGNVLYLIQILVCVLCFFRFRDPDPQSFPDSFECVRTDLLRFEGSSRRRRWRHRLLRDRFASLLRHAFRRFSRAFSNFFVATADRGYRALCVLPFCRGRLALLFEMFTSGLVDKKCFNFANQFCRQMI